MLDRFNKHTASLTFLLPLVLATGCEWNDVEDGNLGELQFTPSNCGKFGCDLDDRLAVGSEISVTLSARDGGSAYGLRSISSEPWIAEVVAQDRGSSSPQFRVRGVAYGGTDLIAIDDFGYEVDYLPIEVAVIPDLEASLVAAGSRAVVVAGFDSAFEVRTGSEVEIEVTPTSRGRDFTGDFDYRLDIDATLAAALLSTSDGAAGHLRLRAPAPGTHDLAFTAPGGAVERIRLIIR